jgi:phage regulator Rha-like protein
MKKTAITISMMNHQNGEQRMTSTEIAELTGKNHKDLLKAIRKMEPAWGKVNGRNFALVEYRDQKGELRPCYSLSKIETLYIAFLMSSLYKISCIVSLCFVSRVHVQRLHD